VRPHVNPFFTWAEVEHQQVREQRGLLRKALGYAVRHREALRRFLEDGRLLLENNCPERELRKIAVGRKAWLFVGSNDHAQSAGHLFTLIATARLNRLAPEAYLRDLLRVLAHWPREPARLRGEDPGHYLRRPALAAIENPGTVTLPKSQG